MNLASSASRFLKLQTASSSGKRINRPSDDPLGIIKDLGYRSRLSEVNQYYLNISHSKSWLTYGDQALNDINGFIVEAKDLAIQLGNDTYDRNARISGATQARELFNQILNAANTQYRNRYIFAGSKTNVPPILATAAGIIYQGDYRDIMMEIENGSYLKINAFARDFITKPVLTLGENFDLNPGIQPNMWLSELNSGHGINMGNGRFIINTLNGSYSIDASAAVNIQHILDAINGAGIFNLTASISDNGNSLQLVDTSPHQITLGTPLSMLNGGTGVSRVPGTFVVRTSDGSLSATIDISAATTVGDVITAINDGLAAAGINNVTASIHPTENRLLLTDTNPTFYNLVIEESGGNQTTAADLGIVGEMVGVMEGQMLNPMHIQVTESAAGQTLAADLGLLKETEFGTLIGGDLNPRLTYFTLLSSLNNNSGITLGKIRITNGLESTDIDLSPLSNDPNATILDLVDMINRSGIGVSAYINPSRTGIMVRSRYDDRSLMITEADSGRTASALGIFGSPDLLGNMRILEQALMRDRTEEINSTLKTFDLSLSQLLRNRSELGAREITSESTQARMETQELEVTRQLSEIEDADILKVITDLATAETIYKTSLASAARIIQPSLLDFLR